MKKTTYWLIAAILLLYPGWIMAQKGSIMAGVEGGPGMALIYGDAPVYGNSSLSLAGAAGIFGEYGFWRDLSVRAALHYERKGSMAENPAITLPPGGKLHYKLDYLSLPLLVRWTFGHNLRFFVNAGPSFSMLMGESLWYIPETGSKSKVADETSAYTRFELSVTAGAGVALPIGKRLMISLEVRDNAGVTNIRTALSEFETRNYVTTAIPKGHTNSVLLLAGVAWRFGNEKGMPCTPNDPDFQYIRK